jgi:hypothetical protein
MTTPIYVPDIDDFMKSGTTRIYGESPFLPGFYGGLGDSSDGTGLGGTFTTSFTRATAGTYRDSSDVMQSAGSGVIRFQNSAYLCEQSRKNIVDDSAIFNPATTDWANAGGVGPSTSYNTAADPKGGTDASVLHDNENSNVSWSRVIAGELGNSETWVASIFVTKASSPSIYPGFGLSLGGGGTPIVVHYTLDHENGTLTQRSGTSAAEEAGAEDWGDFWRFHLTKTNNATGNNTIEIQLFPSVNTDASAAWVATTKGTTTFWGAQMEEGAFPTTMIETSGAAVTRNDDVLEYSSAPATGDMSVKMNFKLLATPTQIGNDEIRLYCSQDTGDDEVVTVGGAAWDVAANGAGYTLTVKSSDFTKGTTHKIGWTAKQSGSTARFIVYLDGVQALDKTITVSLAHSDTKAQIGYFEAGKGPITAEISSVQVWDFAIDEALLKGITT